MATLHINLEKIISQKIEEKIEEILGKAFSNICIDSYEDLPDEKENQDSQADEMCAKKSAAEVFKYDVVTPSEDKKESGTIITADNNLADDIERGWVEKTNAYLYVIEEMKKRLTPEQMEEIATPISTTIKEYAFNNFINNLTWDELNDLFKDNKYLSVCIGEEVNKKALAEYGTTPTDIYYDLLKQIIKNETKNKTELNVTYNPEDILDSIIIREFNKDYNDKVIKLTDYLIEKYHITIFDDIFGEHWYMESERNSNLFLRKRYQANIDQ